MNSIENKIKIIDAICERHPSYGVEKGWSEYTGGMKDSGHWFFRKMLNCTAEELQLFLDDIISEENEPIILLTEQEIADSKIIHNTPNGFWLTEYHRKKLEKMRNDIIVGIMAGRPIKN